MATLFEVEVNTINYHLKEVFKSEELNENSIIRKFRTIAADCKNYNAQFKLYESDFDKEMKKLMNKG